ncbi:hypothetical protein SISNIDRAFT_268503 [Sistotremastrum niveocremeum HHB9708]|uniref:Uncharacterized protein n=2 Tax=Sistotremastraceae TaxID=3402574 RepID=A0A164NZD1_9AGAM|nr:hypothetical protein SISNIDRAFT_268503 [Sistotremastrum niveocremeum HHB9708]KZT36522.1 hypothetical protein SISSUDRAFT_60093 [Sistotremastrum suecicum HHB10207 ss-3]
MSPTLFRSIGEHIALIDSVDFPRGSSPGSANSGDIDDVGDDRSLSSTPPASDARRGRLEERGRSIKVHELGSKETEEDEHMRWSRSPTLPRKAADPRKPIALPVAHPVNSLGNPPQPPVNHGRKPVQSFNPPQSSVRTYVESPRKQAEIHRVEAWRQWQEPQRQWSGGF